MIRLIATLLLLATDVHSMRGVVRLPDGSPCAQCTVAVLDHPMTARTDAGGQFQLSPAPPASFRLVVVSSAGVVYPTARVDGPDDARIITLAPAHQESITVVSGVAPNIEAPPAAASALIAREDLEVRAPATVADAIASVPGASSSDAGPTAVPSIRGLARGRTLLLLDGARVSTERRAGASAGFVDPFSLGSVELARGAGGVGYGSDAFGGVIELQSRYPELADEGQVFYQVTGAGGGTPLASGGLEVRGGGERHALLLDLHARSGGDSEAPDGRSLPTGFRARGVALRYRGALGSGEFRVALSVDEGRDIERATIDAATRPTTYPIEDSRRLTAALDVGPRAGFDRLRVEGFAGAYRLVLERGDLRTSVPAAEISDVESRDASLRVVAGRAVAGGYLQGGYDFATRFRLEAAVTKERFATPSVTMVAIDGASRADHALFASWSRPLSSSLVLGLGLRGDAIRSTNEGGFFGNRSADHVAPSGHVSLTAALRTDTSATLQLSSGFRDPTLSDRYYRGPSGRGTVTGNPDLDPERSVQADGALRWSRGERRVALHAYHYTINDLVERYLAGADSFFRNRGEARLYGVELEAFFPVAQRLSARAGLALARGTADGNDLDDIPAPNASLEMRWAHARGYVFGELRSFGDDDRPGPTELPREGATPIDLGAGWRFGPAAELRIIVHNAGNAEYYAGADEIADLAPGRSVTVMLSGTRMLRR